MNALLRCAVFALSISSALAQDSSDPLVRSFLSPPPSARPQVWWHWTNASATREGITADLEALARVGIGGVQVFDVALIGDDRVFVPQPASYLSAHWVELRRHALAEAKRLGLEVAFHLSPGYSEAGGPWVPPEEAMQHLVWSEVQVVGKNAPVTMRLPLPPTEYGLFQGPPQPGHRSRFASPPADPTKAYRDIAVLAFPTPEGEDIPDPSPVRVTASAALTKPEVLRDHSEATRETFALPSAGHPVWLQYDFAKPFTVRSAVLGCQAFNWFKDGELQASDDGRSWRMVCPLTSILRWDRFLPATTAVPETTARSFRFVFLTGVARATRIDLSEARLSSAARLDHWETKAAYAPALIPPAGTPAPLSPSMAVDVAKVIDLSSQLRADGSLAWAPPSGRWTVVRLGYSPLGMLNHPAMPEAVGLEVDKLNRKAVENFFTGGPAKVIAAAGPFAGTTLTGILMDSWEVFTSNWTPNLREEFRRRRGYDPLLWLPVMTGRVVADRERSERFLFDLRRTLADLLQDDFYAPLTARAHEGGLKLYAEAPGRFWPTVADIFAVKGRVDVPMGEFWNEKAFSNDAKQAVAAAQLYGQRVVAAEAFTSEPEPSGWTESPARFKVIGDRYFAAGINQFMLHTVVQQPWLDRIPGLTLGAYGSHFERTNGWLFIAGPPWIRYLTRCQSILRQGLPVVDLAVFVGEDVPNDLPERTQIRPALPPGYDYGGFSGDALLRRMSVRDGRVVLPDGMSYGALLLPPNTQLTVASARKFRELVVDGVTLIGERPEGSPSLAEYGSGDDEVRRIGTELWPVGAGREGEHRLGKGRVIWGQSLEGGLPAPDFQYDRRSGADLVFTHRHAGDADIYFVSNQLTTAVHLDATFRVAGLRPEFWDAENGTMTEAPGFVVEAGRTRVPLELGPEGSVFVVFRLKRPADTIVGLQRNGRIEPLADLLAPTPGAYAVTTAAGITHRIIIPVPPAALPLSGNWALTFPAEGSQPGAETLNLNQLTSWSDQSSPRIRYFSGTASYQTDFIVPEKDFPSGSIVTLNLGRVETFAQVSLNGHPLPTLWRAPAVLDISESVRPGKNHLEVRVTNLLPNRLIGDQSLPPERRLSWSTYTPYTTNSRLFPAGLLGPVSVSFRPAPLSLDRLSH
jgi:hypothetical protein